MINTQSHVQLVSKSWRELGRKGKRRGFPDRGMIKAAAVQGSSLSLKGIITPLQEKHLGRGCADPDSSPAILTQP